MVVNCVLGRVSWVLGQRADSLRTGKDVLGCAWFRVLFRVVQRYFKERAEIEGGFLTKNRTVPFIPDNILASAIIDRIAHYSMVIKINGPSYRAKNLKKEGGGKG